MSYAAVISLKHTIERFVSFSPQIVTVYNEVLSLQQVLKKSSSSTTMIKAIDGRIRQAVSEFEDVFESYVSEQVALHSQICAGLVKPSVEQRNLKQEIDLFLQSLKEMVKEFIKEREKPISKDDDGDGDGDDADADFGGEKSKIIGLFDLYNRLRDQLTVIEQLLRLKAVALVGMAGIGKTTLARKLFKDPLILEYFDCRAWVKVGRKTELKKILSCILAQVDSDRDEMTEAEEEEIGNRLKESLKGKRYLIVLDDLWETNLLVEVSKFCHYDKEGSRILITSRLQNVGGRGVASLHMRLLNKEESWDLLREKVFEEEPCSYQLEKVGRKIAENCEGLPLTIVKVAEILSKVGDRTLVFWSEVMSKKNHQVYVDAYKEICEVVFPSYDNLPPHLKVCFLYMGVHRPNYEISQSKFINMWISEGIFEVSRSQDWEHDIKACLNELVSHSLVMLDQQSSNSVLAQTKGIKTCKLHPSVWYLCNREAGKNKFFHVLTHLNDTLNHGIESQRRLCIHNSILFGIKDAYDSMVDNCASTARSLLCFGAYHMYQVPICFEIKLLRVLDALTIRMYEFPDEVLGLVLLRYLALTCEGELPASISQLWSLHFLIVNRHLRIKSSESPSYLPIEIWHIKGLKHLQIMGGNLPHPNGAFLSYLDTLLDVSLDGCAEGILLEIPNLKKLGVHILAPGDSSYFNHISHLHKLQTLKCVVLNPEFESCFGQSPLPDLSMLPSCLKKLSLSGLGCPWECMTAIAMLPNLQVLKLRCYAFRGPKWEVQENGFLKLQFLTIEDTNLEEWKVGEGSFPWLYRLNMKHCYELEEIRWEFRLGFLTRIEIVDCNPSGVTCLEQIRDAGLRSRYYVPDICVESSWSRIHGKMKP